MQLPAAVDGAERHAGCRYRALIDQLPELVCSFDPDGVLTFVNQSYAAFHECTPDAMVGKRFIDLVPQELVPRLQDHLAVLLQCTPDAPTRINTSRVVDPTGSHRWHEWTDTAVFEDGVIIGFVAIGRDVTERVAAEERSRYHAEHDDLTGLLNRRTITAALVRLAGRASRSGEHLGVVYVDIDDFKQVNDELGHEAGDQVLVDVADALREVTRVDDLVGRIGGDEFVVLVHPAETDVLERLAERLRAAAGQLERAVGVSIGIALSTLTTSPEALLRLADQSMYADKEARRRAH